MLQDAVDQRKRFSTLFQEVAKWIRQAESQMTTDFEGVNYENVEEQLRLHQVHRSICLMLHVFV